MEERLLNLEKSNGRLKKYVAFIHIFLVGLAFLGFQNTENIFDKIETNKLILRDSKGIERAVFLIDSNDSVKLRFKDKNENTRVSLGVQNDNKGYFGIWDENRYLAYISEGDSSGGYMNFFSRDTNLNNHVTLGIGKVDRGYFGINGSENYLFHVFQNQHNGIEMTFNVNDSTEKGNQAYLICDSNDVRMALSDKESKDYTLLNKYSLNFYTDDLNMTLGQNNMYLNGANGAPILALLTGVFGLSIENKESKSLFTSGVTSTKSSKNDMSLIYLNNNFSQLELLNKNANIGLYSTQDYTSFRILENEKTRFSIHQNRIKDQISTSIFDKFGMLRLNLGNQELKYQNGNNFTSSESSIHLFNSDGNVIFEAPQ